jgi:hypothetical protein
MLSQETRNEIERSAYFKWLDSGKPDGDGLDFWIAAENEFLQNTTKGRCKLQAVWELNPQQDLCNEEVTVNSPVKKNVKNLTWKERLRQFWNQQSDTLQPEASEKSHETVT